jgi:hypothetical protein
VNIADNIKAAIATFCRLNGIDPNSEAVTEFHCAILSELSGALCGQPGFAAEYVAKHEPH